MKYYESYNTSNYVCNFCQQECVIHNPSWRRCEKCLTLFYASDGVLYEIIFPKVNPTMNRYFDVRIMLLYNQIHVIDIRPDKTGILRATTIYLPMIEGLTPTNIGRKLPTIITFS